MAGNGPGATAHARQDVLTVADAEVTAETIIVNELLCFVTAKRRILPDDTIIHLCSTVYKDEAVEEAKKLLYTHCADTENRSHRHITRTGDGKKLKNLSDIVSMINTLGGNLPVTFVAKNLMNLPCVSFKDIDMSALLSRLDDLQTEVDLLKKAMRSQTQICSDLHSVTSDLVASRNSQLESGFPPLISPSKDGIAIDHKDPSETETKTNNRRLRWSEVAACPETQETTSSKMPIGATARFDGVRNASSLRGPSGARPMKKPVVGKAKSVAIRPAKKRLRLANVFASRLDPDLSDADLKSYLAETLKLSADSLMVACVKRSEWHTSFHVKCECENPSIFMNEEIWPEDAYVRWWREPKKTNGQTDQNGTKSTGANDATNATSDNTNGQNEETHMKIVSDDDHNNDITSNKAVA